MRNVDHAVTLLADFIPPQFHRQSVSSSNRNSEWLSLSAGQPKVSAIRRTRAANQTLNGRVKMFTELLSTREPESFGRGQKVG